MMMSFGRRGAPPGPNGPGGYEPAHAPAAPARFEPEDEAPSGDFGLRKRLALALAPAAIAYVFPIFGVFTWLFSGLDLFKSSGGLLMAAPYVSVALLGWALSYPRTSRAMTLSTGLLIAYGLVVPILFNGA